MQLTSLNLIWIPSDLAGKFAFYGALTSDTSDTSVTIRLMMWWRKVYCVKSPHPYDRHPPEATPFTPLMSCRVLGIKQKEECQAA